jgi:hypothetical protein
MHDCRSGPWDASRVHVIDRLSNKPNIHRRHRPVTIQTVAGTPSSPGTMAFCGCVSGCSGSLLTHSSSLISVTLGHAVRLNNSDEFYNSSPDERKHGLLTYLLFLFLFHSRVTTREQPIHGLTVHFKLSQPGTDGHVTCGSYPLHGQIVEQGPCITNKTKIYSEPVCFTTSLILTHSWTTHQHAEQENFHTSHRLMLLRNEPETFYTGLLL